MEKQYFYCRYSSIIRFIIKRPRVLFLLSTVLIIISSNHILLAEEAKAASSSSGFQVFVHVTGGSGKASVCVYSDRQNLGCRAITSPGTVPFVFNAQSIALGQKFKTCIQAVRLYCTASVYDELAGKAKHVYLSMPEVRDDNTNQTKALLGASLSEVSYSENFLLY